MIRQSSVLEMGVMAVLMRATACSVLRASRPRRRKERAPIAR
jgi:hypothetical protein